MSDVGRFAPSTTGPAHPGTLLAALLCWLDARSRGGCVVLRLEDLDPERSTPERVAAMEKGLAWLGLDWDETVRQSANRAAHDDALDRLAAAGALYPCACSRATHKSHGLRAPDGGFRYAGTCRGRALPPGGWRETEEPLRAALPGGVVPCIDESGLDLSQDPAAEYGDPVVRRRDGAIAYHLASVVDDALAGVTRVVRGRDLAPTTGVQLRLRAMLDLPRPVYRHHLLLLEERGEKLAKLHGAVGLPELRGRYDAPALCGFLAWAVELRPDASRISPRDLVAGFAWERVRSADRVVRWDGGRLDLPDAERAG
ncbi:MAG TPA: glutamate--tRNA ligase family protein [Myxococcota bacterium]|nr:glutamate--tRNA ligase family protein [Myxococcota bacterium]